jgi:hypothetical protein
MVINPRANKAPRFYPDGDQGCFLGAGIFCNTLGVKTLPKLMKKEYKFANLRCVVCNLEGTNLNVSLSVPTGMPNSE